MAGQALQHLPGLISQRRFRHRLRVRPVIPSSQVVHADLSGTTVELETVGGWFRKTRTKNQDRSKKAIAKHKREQSSSTHGDILRHLISSHLISHLISTHPISSHPIPLHPSKAGHLHINTSTWLGTRSRSILPAFRTERILFTVPHDTSPPPTHEACRVATNQ